MNDTSADTPEEPEAAGQSEFFLNDAAVQFFQMLPDNREFVFRFLDNFPIPVEIFTPDGTVIFINRAGMELNNIADLNLVVGKYNLLNDPVCNDQLGLRENIQKAFGGEAVFSSDVIAPLQDLMDRGVINEKPFEKSVMDFHLYPVKHNDVLAFVVFVSIVKKLYYGQPDLARVKEYIDSHWRSEFNSHAVAESLDMSERQLYKLFKKHTGMTPGEYYRRCKVERIKEKLADRNVNIKEAFLSCGEDSRGRIARTFKEITGMSPRKYRESLS